MELPLPSQSYQTRSKPLSSQRLVNLYCEVYKDDNGVLRTKSLLGTPGLVENIDFELSTPIYGASFFKNKIVFCIKNRVFEYDKNAEEKIFTVYDWNIFVQPAMYANNTYGLMSDSKNTNNTYKITETSVMEGGVYPDEQGITISTAPDYFVKRSDLPYIVKWKLDDVVKITSLSIKTRLLPQNFITARFYLDESLSQPLGDIFNNNSNDGVATITVSGIPLEGVETDTIYLAILSMEKNDNSSCNITMGTYWAWDTTESNTSGFTTGAGPVVPFKNKYFLKGSNGSTMAYYDSIDNGITWNSKTITSGATHSSFSGLIGNDNIMVATGSNNYQYYTTTDGTNWVTRNNLPSVTLNGITFSSYKIRNVFYVNGYFIMSCVASQSTRFYTFVLYSTNGTSWTASSTYYSANSGEVEIRGFAYDPYYDENGFYYWITYYTASKTGRIEGNRNPYELSGGEKISEIIGSAGDQTIPYCIHVYSGECCIVGTSKGIYDCWYFGESYAEITKTNNEIITSIFHDNNNHVFFGCGPSGVFWLQSFPAQQGTAIYTTFSTESYGLGGFCLNNDTLTSRFKFYAFSNNKRFFGDYILVNNVMPYIKLDNLKINGEVRGEARTTYTRKYEELGIIEDLSNYVDMVDDGDHLFLLHSNGKGYYIEENSDGKLELKEVQDNSVAGFEYQKLKSVCYLAGRFIGVDYSAGTIRWTEILNPNGWNTLNYIQSETSINELTAVRSNTREAWVFSPKNIEVYTPTGSSDSLVLLLEYLVLILIKVVNIKIVLP